MTDSWELALLKRSVKEWNVWRNASPFNGVDLYRADLSSANLSGANLGGAFFWSADLRDADLREANLYRADLRDADIRGVCFWRADLRGANLQGARFISNDGTKVRFEEADLRGANFNRHLLSRANRLGMVKLTGAKFDSASLKDADLIGTEQDTFFSENESVPLSPYIPDWASLIETLVANIFIAAGTIASVIQGLDVIERRLREHQEKHKRQGIQTPLPSSVSSTQPAISSSHKTHAPDKDIIEILLVMDDGSYHSFKRWVSDPDALRAYIDTFSDPNSPAKPLQVVFKKLGGRALVVDVTNGGKDNKQLNVILGYLDADPL
jgi:hypothetical protein